ncbi:PadR family transcription regulator [Natronomonas pharaonis DSM 2160]|uniref:PadR family transcription regulator n=1 Tax=Natronomonas pharaonis (strain ATCC 35678 / DSM 2160 / CIP 103997 / JCM 8858 / NBRC 14720 / NCIMB 2260 / Gabara) TaxID=348780 RepID=A0A1U7EW28_NATPD|nr:helix-turn-helix transcriptional regulator [Natronomonas pharaonis]CAI49274.1 PadR family transcription regulator [Natronomonas pharaonis DSM 2160]
MGSETTAGEARTDTDALPNKKPADLSKFQLRILAVLADAGDAPKGVTVKRRLQEYYSSDVNPGQLYPNLNELVETGFVAKGQKDKRTNAYEITNDGQQALTSEVKWLAARTAGVAEEA